MLFSTHALFFFFHFLIIFIFPINFIEATMFAPISLEGQLFEADAVVEGVYTGHSRYKKLDNDQVVTVYYFFLEREAGLQKSEILKRTQFSIMVPGGTWENVNYKVFGTPSFFKSKKYILLLGRDQYGLWPMNLALGSYSLKVNEGKEYLESNLFPDHPVAGQMPFKRFLEIVQTAFGTSFMDHRLDDKIAHAPNHFKESERLQQERSLTVSEEKNVPLLKVENTSGDFGSIAIFFLLIFIISFLIRKSSD